MCAEEDRDLRNTNQFSDNIDSIGNIYLLTHNIQSGSHFATEEEDNKTAMNGCNILEL